jgi:hypothetical protein
LTVFSPFFNQGLHVGRQFAVENHFLFGDGMNEAQLFGMQSLSGTDGKTVVDELFVFGIDGSFYNPIAPIKIIIEQWMANVLHVHPNLMSSASFQSAFH